jgi:hypothetical protein
MEVTSAKHPNSGYELFPAPSPHNNDYAAGLPQLPEDENDQYPHMAVGNIRMFLVHKYSFYNREKDLARHEAGQVAAKQAAEAKGKPFTPTPFKEKGPSHGTWTWMFSVEDGMQVAEIE